MITRRTLLAGTAGLAAGSLLTGCGQPASALKIRVLEGSVPAEVLQKFRKQSDQAVSFQVVAQMRSLFQQLQSWQSSPEQSFSLRRLLPWTEDKAPPSPDDLVSLGDYWLASAIAQDLVEPLTLPPATLKKLPATWQQLAYRRQSEPQSGSGALWAVPYKVQALVVIYRQSQFSGVSSLPFTTWKELLQPLLQRQIALPDHPRLVIGLAQKMLSGSFNSAHEAPQASDDAVADTAQLAELFSQLNQQVKTYDSDNSLKALINEDVKVAVAWSGDAAAALEQYRDLRAVIPAEGSLLSADMWVRPKGAQMSEQAKQWIDFCWQIGPATQISISGSGLSPIFLGDGADLPVALKGSLFSAPGAANSEPLLPLPTAVQTAYWNLWQQRAG
ncbi:MAG: extracellular solute-binding protein [Phormidesmis sp.]